MFMSAHCFGFGRVFCTRQGAMGGDLISHYQVRTALASTEARGTVEREHTTTTTQAAIVLWRRITNSLLSESAVVCGTGERRQANLGPPISSMRLRFASTPRQCHWKCDRLCAPNPRLDWQRGFPAAGGCRLTWNLYAP